MQITYTLPIYKTWNCEMPQMGEALLPTYSMLNIYINDKS